MNEDAFLILILGVVIILIYAFISWYYHVPSLDDCRYIVEMELYNDWRTDGKVFKSHLAASMWALSNAPKGVNWRVISVKK